MNKENIFYQRIFRVSLILICFLSGSVVAYSQSKWTFEDDSCGNIKWSNNSPYGASDNGTFRLQTKEQTLAAAPKKLSINAGKNGGIRIKGWESDKIYIKACVQARGKDETEAIERVSAIRIETANGEIRAVSPTATDDDYFFGASYDIRVPKNIDLSLTANNGGINLAGISGLIEFDLNNGGVILDRIAGQVRGRTNNGNLVFNLSGEKWDGEGIDAKTNNGSIFINLSPMFSARLETATRRGNFYVNFPIETQRDDKYKLNLSLGTSSTVIKAETNNGFVNIKRQSEKSADKNL